jgi:hypothetical protein
MIDRRGFLKMLGALGASSLIPLEPLLALPEAERPVDVDLGEGVWWMPDGGAPVRLEVVEWSVGTEHETMPDFDRIARSSGVNYIKHSGRSAHFADLKFYGPLLDRSQTRGTLQIRLNMFGGQQFEFADCWMTEWSVTLDPDHPPTQTAKFETGMVTRSEWQQASSAFCRQPR